MSKAKKLPRSWHQFGQKRHLLDVISDGEKQIVVSKVWRRSKQCWGYFAEPRWLIDIELKRQADYRKNARGSAE